ncbi:MAG: hypothetical protein ACW99G_16455 [Candidatus Thorarchaeota archaeon]|jgi:hypothetical protein
MMDYLEPAKPVGWDKRIREIDPKLSTVWNSMRRRWEIHYDAGFGKGPQLAIVVGDGIGFTPLDNRVLRTLRQGDTHNIGPKAITKIMEEGEKAFQRAQEADRDRLTDAASREMADHTRIIQKPIGVVTEKEIAKSKTPALDSSDDSVV